MTKNKVINHPTEAILLLPSLITELLDNISVEFNYVTHSNTNNVSSTFNIINPQDNSVITSINIMWHVDNHISTSINNYIRKAITNTTQQLHTLAEHIVNDFIQPKLIINMSTFSLNINNLTHHQVTLIRDFSNQITNNHCNIRIQ